MINLNDNIPGCKYFKWQEFLWLNSWKVHVFPDNFHYKNIIEMAQKLDKIRDHFNRPIKVTSGYRPQMYNDFISGASRSSHLTGRAVDFVVKNVSAEDARDQICKMLDDLDIRLENHKGNWNHIDLDVSKSRDRFFRP